MPYAIRSNGSFIQVGDDYQPLDGETLYDDVPQWAYDAIEADKLRAEMVAVEGEWRTSEMSFIANQITAIEDEDPTALPGTFNQWKAYRIKVRGWVEGAPNYPDAASRPVRPS
ncbi:hypothetical protein [Pseudomonas sp.]|uniref:hypothetical protein n=1 Tax=Pseudomonas sp. TaxID=306 RepID=UPI003263B3EF